MIIIIIRVHGLESYHWEWWVGHMSHQVKLQLYSVEVFYNPNPNAALFVMISIPLYKVVYTKSISVSSSPPHHRQEYKWNSKCLKFDSSVCGWHTNPNCTAHLFLYLTWSSAGAHIQSKRPDQKGENVSSASPPTKLKTDRPAEIICHQIEFLDSISRVKSKVSPMNRTVTCFLSENCAL